MIKKYFFSCFCLSQMFCFSQTTVKDSLLKGNKIINLTEVVISDSKNYRQGSEIISQIDQQLRPTNSAQDLLNLVPGLFIAQHAGGGKAEQIFLRGFDCDHGTDFSVNIDGMPVNMVSHAHGQGYADFHFVIPETIDKLNVFKGTYNSAYGDFATAGAGEFSTKNNIGKSMVKSEFGQFDTYRAMAMINLLNGKHLFTKQNENWYVAGEGNFANSFLENKQHFKRYNLFTKYTAQLGASNFLSFSGSTFSSNWSASGQIPNRAVNGGGISRFGSLDPTEGGKTSRTNFNAVLLTSLKNGGTLKNQAYYSYYDFNLYSNFTFFLNDTINGDQINQTENGRNIYGYKFSYEKSGLLFGKRIKTLIGATTRVDEGIISLKHSFKRQILDTISSGQLFQQNASAYLDETIRLTEKLTVNTSLRFDFFDFRFKNYKYDSLSGRKQEPKLSPKLNLYYDASDNLQFFAHLGYGFHSNDARSVVLKSSTNNLPTALGYETGATFKLGKRTLINAALWGLHLQNELVYVGDEAIVEITGATKRLGADLSIRMQVSTKWFADLDINSNYGRYVNLPKGENFIPLAPSLTSTGGLSYKQTKGFNASIRYRYLNTRPANESNSVKAIGYFLLDAVINYSQPKYQIGLSAENLLNTIWNQAQFDTESRLKGESTSVSELHYTPGTPFYIKGNLSFFF
jgi:hypothetical protein